MQSLQVLINQLTKNRNLHISILDLDGVLSTSLTKLDFCNVIHSKQFCNIAKSTDKGYRVCMRCKMFSGKKAIGKKEAFEGHCLYGLYELVTPVIINEHVVAIIYVGNAVIDKEFTTDRIERMSKLTGTDRDALISQLNQCEFIDNSNDLLQISQMVQDYLKMLCEKAPPKIKKLSWIVSLMKQYANEMYYTDISLKELANTYHKNEKYIGRLFKKEVEKSFNEYCADIRLENAQKMLVQSDDKIIDIALSCGFNSISYFNRLFKKKFGMSPKEYRANH